MSDAEKPAEAAPPAVGTEQVTLRTLLLFVVGIAAFCGLQVNATRSDAPAPGPMVAVLLMTWVAIGTGFLLVGLQNRSCLMQTAGGLLLLPGSCCLVAPFVSHAGPVAQRVECGDNLRNIALALQNYHDVYGSFPPAYVADANGRPMHSWRVLLLPFVEERRLYEQYDFSEPWDGPNNSRLAACRPKYYFCPSSGGYQAGLTNYLAVVGPETMWPPGSQTKVSDIVDGTNNTIALVESSAAPVPWMSPQDFNFQTLPLTVNAKTGQGISSLHPGGAHVVIVDGANVFLSPKTISPAELRAMLTIAGREPPVAPPGPAFR